jgi:oligopeptidase B
VTDPEILAHLEAENAWFEARMAPHRPLVDSLFKEMRARIKEPTLRCPRRTATGSIG